MQAFDILKIQETPYLTFLQGRITVKQCGMGFIVEMKKLTNHPFDHSKSSFLPDECYRKDQAQLNGSEVNLCGATVNI